MRAGRGRQVVAVAVVGAALGYWLFADTVGRYRAAGRAAGEIRFSYWGGFDDHRMWGKVIAAFESGHPGLRVRPEWLPLSGYGTKLDQQFVAGSAPDVIMFQDEPFPRYVAEQFADLGRFLGGDPETRRRLEDCWPSAGRSFQHDGSLHGLPVMGGNVLIYCNLEAFDRASRSSDLSALSGRPETANPSNFFGGEAEARSCLCQRRTFGRIWDIAWRRVSRKLSFCQTVCQLGKERSQEIGPALFCVCRTCVDEQRGTWPRGV